jgi:hypothetical protein
MSTSLSQKPAPKLTKVRATKTTAKPTATRTTAKSTGRPTRKATKPLTKLVRPTTTKPNRATAKTLRQTWLPLRWETPEWKQTKATRRPSIRNQEIPRKSFKVTFKLE